MNFLKKIFNKSVSDTPKKAKEEDVSLSLDDTFVHHFIEKGGKFLYCLSPEDVTQNLSNILRENDWDTLAVKNKDITKYASTAKVKLKQELCSETPLFTNCEFLIAENGSILFSSNQIKEKKLVNLAENFIVFATTSQIVKCTSDSLTGIRVNYRGNLPTNIGSILNYNLKNTEENFLNYGTNNSKNLYLLLLEDL